jgi:hypothetical protein
MIDPRLDEVLRNELVRLDVDWRNAYAGEMGGELRIHPERAAGLASARALRPAGEGTCTSVLEPLRRLPAHAAEAISEIRGAEWLQLIAREGQWWLIQNEDGYVGWIHSWVVRRHDHGERRKMLRERIGSFARPLGTLWASDHHALEPLVLGCPLFSADGPLEARGDWILVRSGLGHEGWLSASELRREGPLGSMRELLDAGRMLLGTPYRWGGRSPLGFDCSGYVQYLWTLAGQRLPRDTAQQRLCGKTVGLEPQDWEIGDLLFFGDPVDHVAVYDGREGILHCSGSVRAQKLRELAQLMRRLSAVRRVGLDDRGAQATPWMWPKSTHAPS